MDVAEGWENIDSSIYVKIATLPLIGNFILSRMGMPIFPKGIKYGDLLKGLDIKPNSCELIFASHVLEHLSLSDFNLAINNLYSYLQPGGIFRIIVPDLEQYVKAYLADLSNFERSTKASHQFMEGSYLGNRHSRITLLQRCQEVLSNSRHQWMWDKSSLSDALSKHGFKNIHSCHYGEWSDARFELVEKKDRHWYAICLEATK